MAFVHARERKILGVDEGLEQIFRDPRLAAIEVAPDHHHVHDREDASAQKKIALDGARVRKQRRHVGMWMGCCVPVSASISPAASNSLSERPLGSCSIRAGLISGGALGSPWRPG